MTRFRFLRAALTGGAAVTALISSASATEFNIPRGDLKTALDSYAHQAGVQLMYPDDEMRNTLTAGVHGELTAEVALSHILSGTGFATRNVAGAIAIVRVPKNKDGDSTVVRLAGAVPAHAAASVETVVVTSSKIKGDIQTVPIAITALSQEQLTSRQIAGGPDLVKEVPNLTFSKTNFTGYNIQIRGIGTQAISVTTDPAVAVAFNDIPFIRNHFFEQEFFDVEQVEVLRGPQGTLYGRNATAGVVNVVSSKPTDEFEMMLSGDLGNYSNRRLSGMINIPVLDDRLDIRAAAEWTKRDGYTFNETTGQSIDGRDLWSGRITVGFKPFQQLQTYLIWEHFSEDDDRVRSAKQLCKKDEGPTSVDGLDITNLPPQPTASVHSVSAFYRAWLSQGCLPASFYSKDAFETPNGQAIPIVAADEFLFNAFGGPSGGHILYEVDPYARNFQSRNLRVIQSDLSPTYHAKNDVLEFNADLDLLPELKLTSQTGYNKDQLRSTEDFNRFNTAPGIFNGVLGNSRYPAVAPNGTYCDPQLGCSTKMVGEDLSQEHAWQFSQELRLASNFSGPLNFSIGANYMHYQTLEDYFVFFNLITATTQLVNASPPGDLLNGYTCNPIASSSCTPTPIIPEPYFDSDGLAYPSNFAGEFRRDDGSLVFTYIDPNPISSIDGQGHNYFRSANPYRLNSYAGFGEIYYQLAPELKLTAGLRWTDDKKRFANIPSWVFLMGGGYPVQGIVDQEWNQFTGRGVVNWTPKLDFTDETMVYVSYSRGYKGGGANPPGPEVSYFSGQSHIVHPLTFAPEFVNAFEVGTKNTLLDSSLTLNGDLFYYDYKGYQISQIVDRTSINLNFDAKVYGSEVEATWEAAPGLRFAFAGGYEDTSVDKGQSAIDLMDRTAGHTDWMVVKPFLTDTSNCILPAYVVKAIIQSAELDLLNAMSLACEHAYEDHALGVGTQKGHVDPVTYQPYTPYPTVYDLNGNPLSYPGFDPLTAPNNGEGFAKDLSGNKLPNAPKFTTSFSAEYTIPVSDNWAATLHSDFYWQSQSFARIFNDRPYDKIRGYSNVNLALILTGANGWQIMAYVKNIFDTTAITGAFLNSDDTALTTNVFVTDPRLFGLRFTKTW